MTFVNFEKAFDNINGEILFNTMEYIDIQILKIDKFYIQYMKNRKTKSKLNCA